MCKFLSNTSDCIFPLLTLIYRCHGIMNELQSHEWREFKARASEALQADILANVPVEVAALIAGRLDVVDVFRLQRVILR